ncbi:MAG: ATP-binding cassette domain-containing protein [Clostridia bacterium]|jgi:ABC-type multidrug transport system ATPase subunit|nr:ATP-binding cassette domain-containing protein [Clostridia bacterium]MCI9518433.1 ATP-binding cassette domain-containing protein [Clostridia bacterium]
MMKFKNIVKRFGDKTVYDGFSANFDGITAVLGRSGCGKTTLLNIAAKLTDYEGSVEVIGETSYIFQQPRLVKNLTVSENLTLIGADKAQAEKMLKEVGVDGGLYPKQLSGGMADRVSLARAFVRGGGTLLMDEPFRGLDIGLKSRIMELFKKLYGNSGGDVLFVTHSPFEACSLADRAVVLEGGEIIADLIGEELREDRLVEVLKAL